MTPYIDWRTREGSDPILKQLAALEAVERELAEAHLAMIRDLRGLLGDNQ